MRDIIVFLLTTGTIIGVVAYMYYSINIRFFTKTGKNGGSGGMKISRPSRK